MFRPQGSMRREAAALRRMNWIRRSSSNDPLVPACFPGCPAISRGVTGWSKQYTQQMLTGMLVFYRYDNIPSVGVIWRSCGGRESLKPPKWFTKRCWHSARALTLSGWLDAAASSARPNPMQPASADEPVQQGVQPGVPKTADNPMRCVHQQAG